MSDGVHDDEVQDKTGAAVTIRLHEVSDDSGAPGAYTVSLTGEEPVGKAEFMDSAQAPGERIFFHTEVDEAYSGRGLAGLLVQRALSDSIRHQLIVVPVCPLFASHLKKHGDEFLADGGRFRRPTGEDIAQVTQTARRES